MKHLVGICLLVAAVALTGCAPGVGPFGEPPATAQALAQLQLVRNHYAAGRYGDAIRTVATSNELATAPAAVQIEALKLQSFSYCVSNYRQLCEESFARILLIAPNFQLAVAERGHPQWGPAFESARATRKP